MKTKVYKDDCFVNQLTYNNDFKLLFRSKTKYLYVKGVAQKGRSKMF